MRFSRNPGTGAYSLAFSVENLTDRLQQHTILIRLRRERRKKFAPDPQPIYKNEIVVSLFPREKREIWHEVTLAEGQRFSSFEVRPKRWVDF
ncbi:MAG: hypothetical protein HY587_06395 [Candidatus Omnitrophica bacterium]|nr:hypothetical protein [Candidatus Omnitrophota bacterium]